MRKSAIVGALVLLLLFQGVAWAQRVDPARIQRALAQTYIHFFTVKQVFEQCAAISPEQQPAFQKAFSVWQERNQSDWLFIEKSLAKHLEARPTEYKELVDAAPRIAREENLASPYTREMCMTVLMSVNSVRFWDYSLKFYEQLKVLRATTGELLFDSTTDLSQTMEYAHKGDASAQYELGNRYYTGNGIEQSFVSSAQWYKKAAEQGHPRAQWWLGRMHELGWGVEKSKELAFMWMKKAAKQGDKYAATSIAAMYALGEGVAKDIQKSFIWTKKLAEEGDPGSQKLLGLKYENGGGVAQDYEQAMYWYGKAANQTIDPWEAQSAQRYLDSLRRRYQQTK
jgi:TPR repeat protein